MCGGNARKYIVGMMKKWKERVAAARETQTSREVRRSERNRDARQFSHSCNCVSDI